MAMVTYLIASLIFKISFGEYFDCEFYSTEAQCIGDTECVYSAMTTPSCYADCDKLSPPICDDYNCIEDSGSCIFNTNTISTVSPAPAGTPSPVDISNLACTGTSNEPPLGRSSYSCDIGNEICRYIDINSNCSSNCGSEMDPYHNFQAALDGINQETVTLIVKPGIYSGIGNYDIYAQNIYLEIRSQLGSAETIIDCMGEGFGFYFYEVTIRQMSGFTIKNCVAPQRSPWSNLPAYARDNPYIATNNETSPGRLGGAFFMDRVWSNFSDMVIIDNCAEYGGAIFQYQHSLHIYNSIIEYNYASDSGGAIFALYANAYMYDTLITCNDAEIFGGGVFDYRSEARIYESTAISDNTAQFANEFYCDLATVHVDTVNGATLYDNDINNWVVNEVVVCDSCSFYEGPTQQMDFCTKSNKNAISVTQPQAYQWERCVPTISPTTDPTMDPTNDPTSDPTADPTVYPTVDPTADPTNDPTADPTMDPTDDPTMDPTNDPTADPTADPTVDPTNDPTAVPSADPTKDPTSDPTNDPTNDPTADPTIDPTADPTIDPTSDPTSDPTNDPSIDPTIDPTADPTSDPTAKPSAEPTTDPTIDPTADPTTQPPTNDPSVDPTSDPSTNPTHEPTNVPSKAPTEDPTEEPSDVPTSEPTKAPTKQPTEEPTEEPTDSPTKEPTDAPTKEPSDSPTKKPTDAPTKEPTDSPTKEPSDEPTSGPTSAPSVSPTPEPTTDLGCDNGVVRSPQLGRSSYKCQDGEHCVYIDDDSTCSSECGSEISPYQTFQEALDGIEQQTVTIIVKAGNYTGQGNVNITASNIYLEIRSESGSDETIIDCMGEGFGFYLFEVTIKHMSGLTIQNCQAIERVDLEIPDNVQNGYIDSNSLTEYTKDKSKLGGAFFMHNTYANMSDMVIIENGGDFGGAIFQYGNSLHIYNSIIEYNCAQSSGGALFLAFANAYFYNTYIQCNSAEIFGGGIFSHSSRTDILDTTIVRDNIGQFGNEFFCDKSTANVDINGGSLMYDNNINNWQDNEIIYCCCNDCAFYEGPQQQINFCAASDSDKVNVIIPSDDDPVCTLNKDGTNAGNKRFNYFFNHKYIVLIFVLFL